MSNFIERLEVEWIELGDKIGKLEEFVQDGEVKKLDKLDQQLISKQYSQMTDYYNTLTNRLRRAKKKAQDNG